MLSQVYLAACGLSRHFVAPTLPRKQVEKNWREKRAALGANDEKLKKNEIYLKGRKQITACL
jgi:hypothetical protein